jgi:hypothetical protein
VTDAGFFDRLALLNAGEPCSTECWRPREARALERAPGTDQEENVVAETHLSAPCAGPSQKAWVSRAHEEPGWTESPCATPQERAPQSHARLSRRGLAFPATAVSCAALNTTRCIARAAAGRTASSRFFFAPTVSVSAGSAGASRRCSEPRSGATASGAGSAKFSGCTERRLPRDGTL